MSFVERIGFFPKSRRGSRWIRVELSQEYGSDPPSTLEGIQLGETAIRPMGIEWTSRLALSRAAAEYGVGDEW
jgi:hypothetical protein